MSVYSEKLAKLKKEFSDIKTRRGKKKFSDNQQAIYDFVQGSTNKAVLNIKGMTVELQKGDKYFGLEHILLKHYGIGSSGRIEGKHILYLDEMISRGLLWVLGSTNPNNIVYRKAKGIDAHLLILKPTQNGHYVVSFYKED